ncbi:hypothetical protein pb186bvf_007821 [Paramecium bursaria]
MIQTSVAIIKISKQVLLIKRKVNPLDLHSGQLAFPGGKVENNETTLQAAIRETYEEIGLDIHKNIDESPNYFAYFKNCKAYYIKSHIFEYDGPLNFKLSEKEVDKILFIDDTHLKMDNLKFMRTKSQNLNVFSRFQNTQDFLKNKVINDLLYFQFPILKIEKESFYGLSWLIYKHQMMKHQQLVQESFNKYHFGFLDKRKSEFFNQWYYNQRLKQFLD